MNIDYIGEQLFPGWLGTGFVNLAFVAAMLSALAYFFSTSGKSTKSSWEKIGRWSFRIHSIGVIGIIATLLYLLISHRFEYHYIWRHSSEEMPMRYVLSAFWEGQEGSFLLWMFWHMVLGNILLYTAGKWERPVMTVFATVQVFLGSMLLGIGIPEFAFAGIEFAGYNIGSNPFILLRMHPDMIDKPFTQFPNYLASIQGNGLNPLLQNYWMTIHPPTLFLGFASTLVPFAYAIAGLWKKRFNEWMKPALPWTVFGIMALGTGILMGGAWAYEALSFGGFWAWDPVENASLVPWLTLVGGAHVMLINRNKGQSLYTAFFMIISTFILVLYSTFLTRSGILGETSVHAFTDLGMTFQLVIYLLFFVWLSTYLLLIGHKIRKWYNIVTVLLMIFAGGLMFMPQSGVSAVLGVFIVASIIFLIIGYKHFPKKEKEEELWSREFWMFVGALVLFLSAFQIIFNTSIPVLNKITPAFGWLWETLGSISDSELFKKLAAGNQAAKTAPSFYNKWQIHFAAIIGILIGSGQFFKYRNTQFNRFLRNIMVSGGISALLTLTIFLVLEIQKVYLFLLFASLFAAIGNIDYFLRMLKGKISHAGASISHIGFGMILLGALISTSKSDVISSSEYDLSALGEDIDRGENIMLIKGDTVKMGNYLVTYREKFNEGVNIYYAVDYLKPENGEIKKAFSLHPTVQLNPNMGNVAEPDTRHFLDKDIYTHVTYAILGDDAEHSNDKDYKDAKTYTMEVGDTAFSSNSIIILREINRNVDSRKYQLAPGEIAAAAVLESIDIEGKRRIANPLFVISNNQVYTIADVIEDLGLKFEFSNIDPDKGTFEIKVLEKEAVKKDFIVMKAIVFPYINILWTGCILMFIGTILAIRNRVKKRKAVKNAT